MPDDKQERACLDVAAEKLGLRVRAVRKRESPDFEIDLEDGTTVGVEVVQARHAPSARGKAALARLCEKVTAGLEREKAGVVMSVRVNSAELGNLDERTVVRPNVEPLVALGKAYARDGGTALRPYSRAELRTCGVRFVQHVSIVPSEEGSYCLWAIPGHPAGHELIQDAITAKGGLLASYRANLPGRPIWLLVVASLGVGGGIDASEARGTFVSAFDRTLFLEAFEVVARFLTTEPLGT